MKKFLLPAALAAMVSCQAPAPKSAPDTTAQNKMRMQQFYDEVLNAHNTAMLDSFITDNVIDHQSDPAHPDGFQGIAEVRPAIEEWMAAFPDMHIAVNFMMVSGDTVMAHTTMTGTQSGPMGDMPPTNKQVHLDGVDIVVLRDGKAAEHWGYMEESKMMAQLGMMGGGAPADSTAMADDAMPGQ